MSAVRFDAWLSETQASLRRALPNLFGDDISGQWRQAGGVDEVTI